jgi:glycosyltransferase involved in cell wall biosynthesis
MSIDFTVAIPTYNGASRLPRVLEKLQMQVGIEHLSWEIIIVDNNSSDGTAKLVEEYQNNWRHRAKLRYCVMRIFGWVYKMEALALKRCDLIMYTSDWAAETAIKTYGVDAAKVKVIPWGANFECNRALDDIHTIIRAKKRFCRSKFLWSC